MILVIALIIALCGILYQLLIGTLSSFLVGDSIKQFSFTIGFFMSGMGIGAFLTRYLEKNAIVNFLRIELILSVVGASSVIILQMAYVYMKDFGGLGFSFIYFFITIFLGSLVGMEIPLIAEIYKQLKIKTKSIISDVFTFDYIGGLFASLLFPIILLPILGLYNTALFIGTLNLTVGILYINYLKTKKIFLTKYYFYTLGVFIYFIILFFSSGRIEDFYLKFYYQDHVIENQQTEYQQVVLTKRGDALSMFLDGNLQFLSLDEKRYHEALVDWPMNIIKKENIDVLMLGGGDGLAIRNLLKYKSINKITLVELDPKIIEISKNQVDLKKLNKNSLANEKVNIINKDAFQYLLKNKNKYDLIIADFPDPRDVGLSKLYSKEFYYTLYNSLKNDGYLVTQASNAYFANKAFWSINKTIEGVFGETIPYHRYIPSFGDWGFILTKKGTINNKNICYESGCKYFDESYTVDYEKIRENTITKPVIIDYYIEGYNKFRL